MSQETKFAIFCLESYKVHRSLTGKQAVELFEKYGVLTISVNFMTCCTRPGINISTMTLICI